MARLLSHHPLGHSAEQPDEKARRDLRRRHEEPTKPLRRRHTIRVFGVPKRLAHEASRLSPVVPFCGGGNQGEGAVA